jgi:hypothetical protein
MRLACSTPVTRATGYNQAKLHSYNRYKSPNETEADLRMGALAA